MRRVTTLFVLGVLMAASTPAGAVAEICGNGVDETPTNGMTDESCDPAGVTGVCESPLDCAKAGRVAPRTGALVYPVLPDVGWKAPYGMSVSFRRFYTSQYAPGYFPGGVSDHQDSLGYRWQHSYASWVTVVDSTHVVIHTTEGRDVLFTYTSTSGGFDYYTPQKGFYVKHLRVENPSPTTWELKLLTGESYSYTNTSKTLATIKDSVGK